MAIKLFTVKEVAKMLRLSDKTIYRYIALGTIKSVKLGEGPMSQVRFRQDDIYKFIRPHNKRRKPKDYVEVVERIRMREKQLEDLKKVKDKMDIERGTPADIGGD